MKILNDRNIQSSVDADELSAFSHEIAKGVISGKMSMQEAIGRVMNELNCNESYAQACIESWVEKEPTYNGNIMTNSRKSLKSARYIATDTETGEVLGSADTYEEAVQQWGEEVTITDSEATENNEQQSELFQSREITSANNYGWEVDSSEAMEALDMFVEYVGEDTALEELAKALGDNTLEENLEWICRQWGFLEEIEDLDVWEQFETAKEYMGVSELLQNLSQAIGYDELAECMAFIFRMYDFREWDEVSGYDDEDDDEEIAEQNEIDKVLDWCWDVLNKRPENHFGSCTEDEAKDLAKMYKEQGGTFSRIDEFVYIDNEDILQKIANNYFTEEDDDFEEDDEITNSHLFPVKTVKNILSGKWSEDYAAECIAQKQDINVGYAKQVLSSWVEQYKPKLIKSGILDIAEDINTEFDIDGDLESWAGQYTNDSGKANTVGGEMVRAAMQIINRYNNDGDMIGRGYGNESVNPAARYIIEKAEMGVNEQIQSWLDHEERADDNDYDSFIETFTTEIEQILRENPELFQKPNKDDYWDWKEDEDLNYGLDECYLDDGQGNQYWFQLDSGDRWYCTGIELDPYHITYSEGDRIYEDDEYVDEIDRTEEFGSFEADGFIYEYAGDDFDDDTGEYTSWQITKVTPQDPYCDEGDTFDFYDFEPDELIGYTLYDHNGNEVDERTFLASSLKKPVVSGVISVGRYYAEVKDGDEWVILGEDGVGNGSPAEFKNQKDANSKKVYQKAVQMYGPENVRLVKQN
ncbi:MAG: hypothetical protein IKS93_04515 [Methanobrevibacter sp.]|nr:hypothetical protein [Methanobrevibacter sp.]